MDRMRMPAGITPMPTTTIARFMAAYNELCPTVDDDVPVEVFAEHLSCPVASVLTVAEWCRDRDLIDTDAGMGGRVLFELPGSALRLDLAILDDDGRVVVLGEAKRDTAMLEKLRTNVDRRYAGAAPDMTTTKDEARQLAWRLWTVAPDYTWLIGPNHRPAFTTSTSPLGQAVRPTEPPKGRPRRGQGSV